MKQTVHEIRSRIHVPAADASRLGAGTLRKGSGKLTRGADDVVRRTKANDDRLRKLGARLLSKAVPKEKRRVLRAILNRQRDLEATVRLRFSLSETSHGIPWEILWENVLHEFVTLDPRVAVVRSIAGAKLVAPAGAIREKLRILIIAPHPIGQDSTGDRAEERAIRRGLKGLERAGALVVRWVKPATIARFRQELAAGPWHIVHFIGHGSFEREQPWLLFVREDKRPDLVNGTTMAQLLRGAPPRLVILNACVGAKTGAAALPSVASTLCRHGIPAVIAMQNAITNEAAIAFSGELYAQLARGAHVDSAVESARAMVDLASGRLGPPTVEWFTPVLYLGAPDGDVLKLRRLIGAPRPISAKPAADEKPVSPVAGAKGATMSRPRRHPSPPARGALVRREVDPEDPQKGQWGELAERNGRKLTASIGKVKGSKDWYEVALSVISTAPDRPLKGRVTFHLHPTFSVSRQVVDVDADGRASIVVIAWGAFTVGAVADGGRTKLELDLAAVDSAPRAFRDA